MITSKSTHHKARRIQRILATAIALWSLFSWHLNIQLHRHAGALTESHSKLFNRNSTVEQSNENSKSTKEQGAAACLLVNDENPRLPEWLAYHYHMLPLRSLIITIDPASRTSPLDILNRWRNELEIIVWEEEEFLPEIDSAHSGVILRGACKPDEHEDGTDCLWHYLKRQRFFVKKCLAYYKRQNRTWVLLTDVDEYITFNNIEENDPNLPLDYAPEGIPMLSSWKRKEHPVIDKSGRVFTEASVTGVITKLPQEGLNGIHNGVKIKTRSLVTDNDQDILIGKHGLQSGNVIIENKTGIKYYLRDDYAFRQATQMENPPRSVPVLKNAFIDNDRGVLRGKIYDDYFTNHHNGELVEIKTNWREPPINISILGGHLINSLDGKSFYVQRDTLLWPPMLSAKESLDIRQRLPHVGNGKTILDVLQAEMSRLGDYALDTIGPCLAMPRLLYGSREDEFTTHMAPDGFDDSNFVTLRYRWHAVKEAEVNKYQKAIIDVSRVAESLLLGEAESIHVPLNPYYCRSLSSGGPPRYATSFFRVNHYLDSFQAYSYRNDARASKRKCIECYNEKLKETNSTANDSIRPWLKSFVESVGIQRAKILLDGAGNFSSIT